MGVHVCIRIMPETQRSVVLRVAGRHPWVPWVRGRHYQFHFAQEDTELIWPKSQGNRKSLVSPGLLDTNAYGHFAALPFFLVWQDRRCPLSSSSSLFEEFWSWFWGKPRPESPDSQTSVCSPGPCFLLHSLQGQSISTLLPYKGLLNLEPGKRSGINQTPKYVGHST